MRNHRTDHDLGIDVVNPAAIAADQSLMRVVCGNLFGEAEVFRVLLHVWADV